MAIILYFLALVITFTSENALAYIKNSQCVSCHQSTAQQWQQSDHFYAMSRVSPKTVLANFKDGVFQFDETTSYFKSRGNNFYIKECNKKHCSTYHVVYTFGHYPLQQYIVDLEKGKRQVYPVAWDVKKKAFFHLQPKSERYIKSPFYWQKQYANWNHSCADCHSTNVEKNFSKGAYTTRFNDINVGCQACHGEGESHLIHLNNPAKKELGFIRKPTLSQCAQCHSRRAKLSNHHTPNQDFHHNYRLSLIIPGLYYPDGQIKDEVFVYGSFLQSKMYMQGVTCTDCHTPHSGKLKLKGNLVCTQCHNAKPTKRFSGLKSKDYNQLSHTHHKKDSTGSVCINCHMPQTTYMGNDQRADHKFLIPNPELTIKHEIPNACNRCHQNKSAQWSQKAMQDWEVKSSLTLLLKRHGSDLNKILHSKTTSPIYKASALWLLDFTEVKNIEWLKSSLKSKHYLIKRTALELCQRVHLEECRVALIKNTHSANPYLKAISRFTMASARSSSEFIKPYIHLQSANLDTSDAWINLAILNLKQANSKEAIVKLKQAIKIDNHAVRAYLILSKLYSMEGKLKLSAQILKLAVDNNEKSAQLLLSYGLALAAINDLTKAEKVLSQTIILAPFMIDPVYNLVLIKIKMGKNWEALQLLDTKLKQLSNPPRLQQLKKQLSSIGGEEQSAVVKN